MRSFIQSVSVLVVTLAAGALAGVSPSPARAEGGSVGILVLKEHGVGSAAQAQPFLDKFVALAARQNGWADGKGQYTTTRPAAEAWIKANKPHYGILSLAAFLALKDPYRTEVVGQVAVARGGGAQYFVVSKTATDLAGCKGKALASDHTDDAKFIEKVVFAGQAKLSDFTLAQTTRPLQTIKKVIADEAACALIDDAQLAELAKIDGGAAVKTVWSSDKLPPMVMVAFPDAPAAERKAFSESLAKLCPADPTACTDTGINSMKSASPADYATVVAAYAK